MPTGIPTPEQFNKAIGRMEKTRDTADEASLPRGKFTPARLSALGAALDRLLQMADKTVKPGNYAAKGDALPLDLVRRYEAAAKTIADFLPTDGAPKVPPLPPVERLATDETMLLAISSLGAVAKSPAFKTFLATPVPEAPAVEPEVTAPVEQPPDPTMDHPFAGFLKAGPGVPDAV